MRERSLAIFEAADSSEPTTTTQLNEPVELTNGLLQRLFKTLARSDAGVDVEPLEAVRRAGSRSSAFC